MYRKDSIKWIKHWDFILLDLLMLQLAYAVSSGFDISTGLFLCLADICCAFFMEGYHGIMRRGYLQEFKAVLKQVSFIGIAVVLYLFLSRSSYRVPRSSFIMGILLAVGFMYGGRILWKLYLLKHKKIFYQKKAILVLTTSRRAEAVISNIQNNTFNELEIIGTVIVDRDDWVGKKIGGVKVVCRENEILDYIQTRWLDGVLINVNRGLHIPEELITTCIEMGISVHHALTVVGENTRNQQVDRLGGYVVLSTNVRMATPRQLFLKRALDLCGAVVGLLLTGILTVFLAPALYLASPGPIFFSQIRVGQNGRKFKIYKFRSMYMDAEERKKELMERNEMKGFMFKIDADPRIVGSGPDGTRKGLGWFIRKTSIDEFPQFLNVLKGEMSLVGTRPPTVDEWEKYKHHHRGRLATKPGITGMWQVSGRSDITDFEEVVRLDMEYIQKWNIGLDIKILIKTVLVVFEGRGSK